MELYDDSFDFCDYNKSGIKKIQITDYDYFKPYYQDINTNQITGFEIYIPQYSMDNNYDLCSFTETSKGPIQEQTLTINQLQLDQDKQNVLKKLSNRNVMVMFLDQNNKGQYFSSRVAAMTESSSQTGSKQGENNYTIVIKSKSDYQIRRLADAYMDLYIDCDYCNCNLYASEIALTSTVGVSLIQNCLVGDFDGTL